MGTGKGAALVPEQRGFHHLFGKRGAVHRDEGGFAARGGLMHKPGQPFLASAGGTFDQHTGRAEPNPRRQFQQIA